jgi:hypothetical protein
MGTAVAVNIASTLLLVASDSCAQLLASPTRAEVDASHARGLWIEIGVHGFRNLASMSKIRVCLWSLLYLSSLPLPGGLGGRQNCNCSGVSVFSVGANEDTTGCFLYHCDGTTKDANDYLAFVVTEDFVAGGWWNQSALSSQSPYSERHYDNASVITAAATAQALQDNFSTLTKLDPVACLQAYATSMVGNDWLNTLVVADQPNKDNLISWYAHSVDDPTGWDVGCPCMNESNRSAVSITSAGSSIVYGADSIIVGVGTHCGVKPLGAVWSLSDLGMSPMAGRILYCLAQPFRADCELKIAPLLLLVVIVCNASKFAYMLVILRSNHFTPLLTVGDAVASFIDDPDPTTVSKGTVSDSRAKTAARKARKPSASEIHPGLQPWGLENTNNSRNRWQTHPFTW